MDYEVFILRRAQKDLANLPKPNYPRMRDSIAALASNPRPVGCKKLTDAKAGEFVRGIIE